MDRREGHGTSRKSGRRGNLKEMVTVQQRPVPLAPQRGMMQASRPESCVVSLGERIHELRLAHLPPLRQIDLARLVGVDRGTIGALEVGKRPLPSAALLRALAVALGTSPADLLAAAGYLPASEEEWLGAEEDVRYRLLLRRAAGVTDASARRLIGALLRELLSGIGETP